MSCPGEEDLAAFVSGGLSAGDRDRIELHFDSCSECRMIAAELLRSSGPDEPDLPRAKPSIGRFEIIETLGSGAMGVVYLAHDPMLKRKVAVKVMRSDVSRATDDDLKARMLQEARTMAQLSHDNVVTVHEVGFHGDSLFIAMEHVAGVTLKEWLARGQHWRDVLDVFKRAGRGLGAAHTAGMLHRDFKPDNVLISEDGRVRVSDFGLARSAGDMTDVDPDSILSQHPITATGVLLGTPAYMAPEQWAADDLSPATDQFAFAVALYEGLYGVRPFDAGSSLEVALRVREGAPSPPPADSDVPTEIFEVICRALSKSPQRRYPSVDDLLADLDYAISPEPYSSQSPYVGLSAFDESQASQFFGRDREVRSVTEKLSAGPFVAVIGPSGVGKSSLIRAGVIPAYRSLQPIARVDVVRPGRDPLSALAELGGDPSHPHDWARHLAARGQLLLYIDQFEELYALDHDPAIRRGFADCLAALCRQHSTAVRVIVSMRSDFLDRVAEHREFAAVLSTGVAMIGPADRDTLREALVLPAELRGFAFESRALVDDIIAELDGTPGALPLLQFAADQLWATRDEDRKLITREGYQAIGTVAGALAAHADRVLDALNRGDREAAKVIFKRLVTASETRDLVAESEIASVLGSVETAHRLLDAFDEQRLVVLAQEDGDSVVALSHESLISSWPTLRHWIDESSEFSAVIGELRAAARIWDSRGRPGDMVWTGRSLEELRVALRRAAPRLTDGERAFVAAGERLATRAVRRRRAGWIAAMAILSMIAVGASVAFLQVRAAEKRATRAAEEKTIEAERAKKAEAAVQNQLDELLAAQEARKVAEAQASKSATAASIAREDAKERGRELKMTYAELEAAASRYRAESRRARLAAEAERQAVAKLEKLLASERKRRVEAERNRGTRATKLTK